MSTESELNNVLKTFELDSKQDVTTAELIQALEDYKKMILDGLAKPRGYQLEDALNRNSYSMTHTQV